MSKKGLATPSAENDDTNFLAYTAGFFDADGSVGVYWAKDKKSRHDGYFCLHVTIAQAQWMPIFLEWKGRWGGSLNNNSRGGYFVWHWTIASRNVLKFLLEILPFVRKKRDQADLAIEFQRRKVPRRRVTREERAWQKTVSEVLKEMKRTSEQAPEELLLQIRRDLEKLGHQLELWTED